MLLTDVDSQRIQYGIVIDAGSSGSRIFVYQWEDPAHVFESANSEDQESSTDLNLLHSIPQIHQEDNWTYKISPGLSSFKDSPSKAFPKHVKPLLDFAAEIIPAEKLGDTPIFIQATAGMRLLPDEKRTKILEQLCTSIRSETNFQLTDCSSQIQIIDGETEGLYGWLSLNYLLGNFNNFNSLSQQHSSDGFMDMGGASTQLAFMPSDKEEISKHKEDINTIYLRNVNGDIQEWDVFVSTWLGFGANKARSRYLAQLINSLPENANDEDYDDFSTRTINDPCLPKGATTEFEFKDKDFNVVGVGNYESCIKSIYPLLLKNLPCSEEPCLFNGVHAPKIDFEKDRFVGISEYWYTANDVFKVSGEYNFQEFTANIKDFCESDWDVLKQNNAEGLYNGMSDEFLLDSCFKANWVLNVLHEGFDLPRLYVDIPNAGEDIEKHVPFKSADSINGRELSWTLGRIIMYVSSLVTVGSTTEHVGIMPTQLEQDKYGKEFIFGGIVGLSKTAGPSFIRFSFSRFLSHFLMISLFFIILYITLFKLHLKRHLSDHRISEGFTYIKNKAIKLKSYRPLPMDDYNLGKLEEGVLTRERFTHQDHDGFNFRSRSMMNLGETTGSSEQYPMSDRKPSSVHPSMKPVFSMADFSKLKSSNID